MAYSKGNYYSKVPEGFQTIETHMNMNIDRLVISCPPPSPHFSPPPFRIHACSVLRWISETVLFSVSPTTHDLDEPAICFLPFVFLVYCPVDPGDRYIQVIFVYKHIYLAPRTLISRLPRHSDGHTSINVITKMRC